MAICLAALLPSAAALGGEKPRQTGASPFMRIYGPALPPFGFVRFCEQSPNHCRKPVMQPKSRRPRATHASLRQLDDINRFVNATISPLTDKEIYGVNEHWTLPDILGDCEDFALLKRDMLIKRGWPPGALLMTVVRDEAGDGHAVLTVRTTGGDYILDNKITDVRLWHKTPYSFVMRQSYLNPKIWVSLDPGNSTRPEQFSGISSGN